VFAAEWGTGQVFWSFLWFFIFFVWIMLLLQIFGDIFRSEDLSGGGKAFWCIFVILLPYLGVFVYLIARGAKMHERAIKQAQVEDARTREYIQSVAAAPSMADDLEKLAALHSSGKLADAEYESAKAKLLA
jgi:Phospholipase_D-nuclease N-terminal